MTPARARPALPPGGGVSHGHARLAMLDHNAPKKRKTPGAIIAHVLYVAGTPDQ
jgi:hypothetical protein